MFNPCVFYAQKIQNRNKNDYTSWARMYCLRGFRWRNSRLWMKNRKKKSGISSFRALFASTAFVHTSEWYIFRPDGFPEMGSRSRSEIDLAESIARSRNQDDPSRPALRSLAQTTMSRTAAIIESARACGITRIGMREMTDRARGSTGRTRLESFEPWSLCASPETMESRAGIVRGHTWHRVHKDNRS